MVKPDFNIHQRHSTGDLATRDTAMVLLGKMMDDYYGEKKYVPEAIEVIIEDPKRMLGVTMVLLNITSGLAMHSPGGMRGLVDHFLNEAADA